MTVLLYTYISNTYKRMNYVNHNKLYTIIDLPLDTFKLSPVKVNLPNVH